MKKIVQRFTALTIFMEKHRQLSLQFKILSFSCFFLLFLSQNVGAGIKQWLDSIIGISSPIERYIYLDRAGVLVDEEFEVKTYCSYDQLILLLHKKEGLNEYKYLIKYIGRKDKILPLNLELKIFHVCNGEEKEIYYRKEFPRLAGRGIDSTAFSLPTSSCTDLLSSSVDDSSLFFFEAFPSLVENSTFFNNYTRQVTCKT